MPTGPRSSGSSPTCATRAADCAAWSALLCEARCSSSNDRSRAEVPFTAGAEPMAHSVRRPLSRRTLIRAGCVALALPLLEAMRPAARTRAAEGAASASRPRRMVLINACLGLYGPDFFPAEAGRDYALTPYLGELADWRNEFTVVSGLSHPEVGGGGHTSEASF